MFNEVFKISRLLNLLDALFGQTSRQPSMMVGKGVWEGGFGVICFIKKTLAIGDLFPPIFGFAFAML